MANRDNRNIKFKSLIAKGENPLGLTAQTVNGTAHATGQGWNKRSTGFASREAPEGGAWGSKRSNRTGE